MKIEFPLAVRDLYDSELRLALHACQIIRSVEGDIVAVGRPIVYIPEEREFDHRYSGEFYQMQKKTLWPLSISSMREIWRERAFQVGRALRNCQKLEDATGVSILLARDKGLDTEEVTLFCTNAGVVWRIEGHGWNTKLKNEEDIKFAVSCLYGGYLDQRAYEEDEKESSWALSKLMTAIINFDAYNLAGDADSEDAPELVLASKMVTIEIVASPWFPNLARSNQKSE